MHRTGWSTRRLASPSLISQAFWLQPLRLLLRWLIRLRLFWLILVAFLFLSGCVRYDVGVNFADTNHGTITQQIHLSSQLTGVSRATANIWLNSLTKQAEELGGEVKSLTNRDWLMTIPFYNAKDFVTKFDLFFQTLTSQSEQSNSMSASRLRLKTNNFILWQRNYLDYYLDLRSLSIIPDASNTTTLLVDPADFLALKFMLNTPWGAHSLLDSSSPTVRRHGRQLIWNLKPGEVNHLEAVFSVPSPIGIGLTVIVVLVAGGMFVRAWRNPTSLIDLPPDLSSDVPSL